MSNYVIGTLSNYVIGPLSNYVTGKPSDLSNFMIADKYARLGHRLKGVEGIYGHSTPQMELDISKALQNRWEDSGGSVFAAALARTIATHSLTCRIAGRMRQPTRAVAIHELS